MTKARVFEGFDGPRNSNVTVRLVWIWTVTVLSYNVKAAAAEGRLPLGIE